MAPNISTAVYSASSSPFFHSGLQTGPQPEDNPPEMGEFDDDGATIETASITEVDISEVRNDLYANKFYHGSPDIYVEDYKSAPQLGQGASRPQTPTGTSTLPVGY